MHEVLNMGRLDIIAQCLAGLIELGRTHLAVEGTRALAHTATAKAVCMKFPFQRPSLVSSSVRDVQTLL